VKGAKPRMREAFGAAWPRVAVLALLAAGCAAAGGATDPAAVPRSTSRAVPEARGDVVTDADGTRRAVRYPGWTTQDFGRFRTYAYDDARPEPPVERVTMPRDLRGDPARGRALFVARNKGPCTGCHLIPGDDVWPAGGVGPDLSTIGDRRLSDDYLYQQIHDPRAVFPKTAMPPWGAAGIFSRQEIVDLVAFMQSLRGPLPPEGDPDRNPATRPRPAGFGDNLDPTNNPGVVLAEDAEERWKARGPAGKACADCHEGGPARAMRGVATQYPKVVARYARVMAIEDFLAAHAPETTGREMAMESDDNVTMTVLVKMASNGLPVALDLASPAARAAVERGHATFERRVGQRNHACADCHRRDRGADKFLGGRLLADVSTGLTRHFPTWRTSQNQLWDMRKRFQWCMTPLGMNMLAADSVEYAELELYLTSFDDGKPLSVPGIRH
jgi:L-cysteine S-thiosulfotransferase